MDKTSPKASYIILLSAVFGLLAVFFGVLVDSVFVGDQTFAEAFFYNVSPADIYIRVIIFVFFIGFGIAVAVFSKRLKDSEVRFATLSDESPNMIFINKVGRIVYVNSRCEQVMGFKKEEFYSPGFYFMDLVAVEDLDRVRANFARHAVGEEVAPKEYTFVTKNGKRIESILSTKLIDYRGAKAIMGVITDITERKKAEDELRTSEENFRRSMDNNPLGIRIFDSNWKTIYVNNTLMDMYSFKSLEEFNTTPDEKIYTPESYAEHLMRAEKVKRGEVISSNHEISIMRKDGVIRHFEVTHREVIWDHEPRRQMLYRDVTEVKQMQEQLIRQDRLVSLGQLVSGVAHELNNPLTSVVGFSELLLQKEELPENVRADLKIVNDEAKRTSTIVKNLLTFARQQPEVKSVLDVNEPIKTVLELRNYEQTTGGIKVTARFAAGLPPVMANASQLQQVFFNLVTNAEQAMLEANSGGNLTVITEEKGNFVRASFIDNGPGISRESMARLFSPFFTTKGIGQGTGLGLSISQGIISDHGGKIWAESVKGKGSTFIIELPVFKTAGTGD